MRVCSTKLALLACALAGACHKSSSSGAPILASSRIGPEGGVLIVASGNQAGLILTVDPGVLTAFVDFQIRDFVPDPGVGSVVDAGVALPFRIEPEDLVLSQNVRLHLPYQPTAVFGTAPGNVEVNQVSPFTARGYNPEVVSVTEGFVEIEVKTFGQFRVVIGERVDPLDYVPPVGVVTQLGNGYEFEVKDAAPMSEFAAQFAKEWRITGPQFDESVIFVGYDVVGRLSESASWLEIWDDSFRPFQLTGSGFVLPTTGIMQVQSPIGQPSLGASVLPFGFMSYELPVEYNGVLLRDIMKVALNVAYSRADLGTAERQMIYWFSPSVGLLQVSIDGIIYDRIP
ncbi:MAG: hypothetical protein ACI89X_000312 [Planctomycetota bacterium]|jgi:hypothetical protein